MQNDTLTIILATKCARAAVISSKDPTLPPALACFGTQEFARHSARHEFAVCAPPNGGGFNEALAHETVAQIFAESE